jgi:hypothetical protein
MGCWKVGERGGKSVWWSRGIDGAGGGFGKEPYSNAIARVPFAKVGRIDCTFGAMSGVHITNLAPEILIQCNNVASTSTTTLMREYL